MFVSQHDCLINLLYLQDRFLLHILPIVPILKYLITYPLIQFSIPRKNWKVYSMPIGPTNNTKGNANIRPFFFSPILIPPHVGSCTIEMFFNQVASYSVYFGYSLHVSVISKFGNITIRYALQDNHIILSSYYLTYFT